MLALFKKLDKKMVPTPKPRKGYRKFDQGGCWGYNITCERHKKKKGYFSHSGHWSPIPENGDIMLTKMKSGKICVSVFCNVKGCHDPHDMFFADSFILGYEDELKEPYN